MKGCAGQGTREENTSRGTREGAKKRGHVWKGRWGVSVWEDAGSV